MKVINLDKNQKHPPKTMVPPFSPPSPLDSSCRVSSPVFWHMKWSSKSSLTYPLTTMGEATQFASLSNPPNQIAGQGHLLPGKSKLTIWGSIWKRTVEKIKQVRPVRLYINPSWHFEEAFENAQWWKIKQVRPVRLYINQSWQFEEAFENTQWRKNQTSATSRTLYQSKLTF